MTDAADWQSAPRHVLLIAGWAADEQMLEPLARALTAGWQGGVCRVEVTSVHSLLGETTGDATGFGDGNASLRPCHALRSPGVPPRPATLRSTPRRWQPGCETRPQQRWSVGRWEASLRWRPRFTIQTLCGGWRWSARAPGSVRTARGRAHFSALARPRSATIKPAEK